MKTKEEHESLEGFSLLGGPLHRLGRRLGLVRGEANTVPFGLALGLTCWSVLAVLALIGGDGHRLFSLSVVGVHIRLLVVIPLLFYCEKLLEPRLASFVDLITRSGIVPQSSLPALRAEVARTTRRKDSWLPEAACVVGVALMSVGGSALQMPGVTSAMDPSRAGANMPMAAGWYWIVCLSLFRFLALRWLWRLGLWFYFLWRLAKLEINLVPTHPDGAGGLGYLEVVHTHFLPLVLAISALQAGSFAEEITLGTTSFEAIYPTIALILVVDVALFVGPLFIFMPKLWACRVKGLSEYMQFAENYVRGFDRKWLRGDAPPVEELLGTPDLQSLADLNNSISVVRNMRVVPSSLLMLRDLAVTALAPILPLFLLKYPLSELAQKFFTRLSGL